MLPPPPPFSQEEWDILIRYIGGKVGCVSTAEDIAHDAYLVALEQKLLLVPYIWGIVQNKINEHYRRRIRFSKASGVEAVDLHAPDPWESARKEHEEDELRLAMTCLSDESRTLIDQVYRQGLSQIQVANGQSRSHAAVRKEISRLRSTLRSMLAPVLGTALIILSLLVDDDRLTDGIRFSPPAVSPTTASGPAKGQETSIVTDSDEQSSCDAGESCRECTCTEGLVCHRLTCTEPSGIDRSLLDSTNRELGDAIKALSERAVRAKEPRRIGDLKKFALRNNELDLLLSAFPERLAFFLPRGEPKAWSTPEIRDLYLERMRPYYSTVERGVTIFIVGRASAGDSEYQLALRRMAFVEGLIQSMLHEQDSTEGLPPRRVRIRSFVHSSRRSVESQTYMRNYLTNPADGEQGGAKLLPVISWDKAVDQRLASLQVEESQQESEMSLQSRIRLSDEFNRMVLVIPIPFTGNTYAPSAQDLVPGM